MNIKRNISFALEKRKKNGVPIVENVPIRMRVMFGGKRIEFTTGYRIDIAKWDKDKQRVKNGITNKLKQSASEINTELQYYYAEIQNVFKEFEVQNTFPTTEDVKTLFNTRLKPRISENTQNDLVQSVFIDFVKERSVQNNWTKSTHKKFATVKRHLENFNDKLCLQDISEDILNDYVAFLQMEKDMRNSTIRKQLEFVRSFLRWCSKKGYNVNPAFEDFKPKLKNVKNGIIFLTWEEQRKLIDLKLPESKQYLERVRDVFIFCCFTGLRYSDVYNLKHSNIKQDHIEITIAERYSINIRTLSSKTTKSYLSSVTRR